jgi:hypothetical protein
MNETAVSINAGQSHFLAVDHGARRGSGCFIYRGKTKTKNVKAQQVSGARDA